VALLVRHGDLAVARAFCAARGGPGVPREGDKALGYYAYGFVAPRPRANTPASPGW